jgi:hypothetical protein
MKYKISSIVTAAGFALVAPLLTFATSTNTGGVFTADSGIFGSIIKFLQGIITAAFPIITGILVILFGFQVFKYLTDKNETEKAIHKSNLLKAIMAIFLWFVLTGLIRVLATTLGIQVGGNVVSEEVVSFDDLTP